MVPKKRNASDVEDASTEMAGRPKKDVEKTALWERPDRRSIAETNQPRSLRSSVPNGSTPLQSNVRSPIKEDAVGKPKRIMKKGKASSEMTNRTTNGPIEHTSEHVDIQIKSKIKSKSTSLKDNTETAEEEGGDGFEGLQYWLMKAEPESRTEKGRDTKFSIDDLQAATDPEAWDGVRNYGARNNMRAMMKGDQAFFYHSNCKVPGIVGTMEVVHGHSVDESAFDTEHPYHDEKSTRENPKWCVVHVAFRQKFPKIITLRALQQFGKGGGVLEKMQLLKQSRLSVSRVSKKEWDFIMGLVEYNAGAETSEAGPQAKS